MKKYFYILTIFTISCSKVTDQVADSIITGTNFFKTASDADNAINGCYDALQGGAANYVIWGDGRTDIFAVTDRSGSADLTVVSGAISANGGYVGWNSLYTGINRCNSVLKNVPNIDDPALAVRKERIIGEAYFLRALFYFYLARTQETAPLITEAYESLKADFFPPNSNRAALFAQVEADLKEAESRVPDLPFSTTIENKGKATKGAIRSTMADLYLWQKKYQEAADAADLVIKSPANYSLVAGSSFGTLFTDKNTRESILEVQYNYTFLEGNTNGLTELFLPIGGSYTAGNWRYQPSAALLNELPSTDLRAPITYRNTGATPAPYRDANQTYIAKYPGTLVGNTLYYDANRIVYRLAEIILFRAEALNELGQTADAVLLLDQVRKRAGLGETTAETQEEVRLAIERERFVELAYEGKRYYDLIRTGRYAVVTGHTDPNWLRWPIPDGELLRNPNLDQNDGY
ncbi:MAG: RagB/SusD family nutrient uptake outer membrane protein [Candidatus Pseudobacter hemicellulosilyticus]|uniref:RagB/SusD family nutrient uptake outer membrane protein n=1 Tax=Candidatus Pseudobacter hemicellulosilyticus TaxID=3121375 RepID=A0AAJ5WQ23_9BACT|nr:MAG: RagB/SusD family nutrient uptake outer membrane protein [Pseudobacter sp.]